MKKRYINAFSLIIIVLIVAFGAFYIGQRYMPSHNEQHGDIHGYLHQELNITPQQDKELNEIETRYQQRKQSLEETIRLANIELANAIKEDPSFSPQVQQAVDKIHEAMGELQKASLEHLFEMQPILTSEQNKKLNKFITDALFENAHN